MVQRKQQEIKTALVLTNLPWLLGLYQYQNTKGHDVLKTLTIDLLAHFILLVSSYTPWKPWEFLMF